MPFNARHRLAKTVLTLAAAGAAVCGGVLVAQVRTLPVQQAQPQQRGGLNPDSFYGKETFQGVSVRDSLEAIKKLEDARRMERLADWNKAADWYQEVIEKYGQYVVPSGTDAQNNIRQYTGIERPVQEQLAKWPKAGLDAYRNRYGAVAAALLDQAKQGDKETLSRVMKLYFVTDAGKQAGVRLVDMLLEDGDFAEAARVGDRLLDWHPNLVVERPKVLFRTALAYHLSGDQKRATERAEQLKNKFAGAVGTLFGKDIVLADALNRLMEVAPPVSVATSSGSVRLNPGGDESRSMISAATGRPGARLATIELTPRPVARAGQPVQAPDGEIITRREQDPGAGLGILPVADDGELYFQDGSRVYAVSLQSGVPLPGWTQSYPNSNGQYTINSFGFSRTQQFSLTLTDNAVLGVMGFSDRQVNGMPAYGNDRGTRLVCLDRATGKEKWVSRPGKIPEENLRALDFSGSPLVVGDNVYVIGRGGKNMTAEDCYVVCLDLNNGNYKWSCFIASSNNNAYAYGQMPTADTLSHLAYSSGRVYVLTNVGACAALDAYSGTISWLNIYPRDTAMLDPNQMNWRGINGIRQGTSSAKAWEYNAVIVQDGKVFILPSDAKHLIVYDAGTGAELKRIAISDFQMRPDDASGPEALIAVDGKQVFLTGGTLVYCIDWTQPTRSDKSDAPSPCIVWTSTASSNVRGRAFVTSKYVFVCTESAPSYAKDEQSKRGGLLRIDRATGKVMDTYPAKRDWDEGEGPGNVLVIGNEVVVAGAKRVNVYADMALARKRLDDDVAAAPADPEPRLRYAEVMFVAGQLPVAMEKLDETVKLLGGLKSMRSGGERDHLFNDCITFAAKLQREKKADTIDEVTRLYDLAGDAADGDSQQVNYRISRAKFDRDFVQEDSLASAVKLYQEILASPKLRTVPLADEEAGGVQAAQVAERMIEQVKKLKPQAYEAFEAQAADALQAAGEDPALLKAVAETFPNATAAPKAMIAASAAYEAQSNYRLAVYTLRQAYNKYGESGDKPRLLEAMARNYLAMPDRTADRVDTAAARLATAVKLGAASNPLAKPLKLPGDKELAAAGTTIADALKALQNYKTQAVTAKLPNFHIPGRPSDEQLKAHRAALAAWRDAGSDPATRPLLNPPFVTDPAKQLIIPNVSALIEPPSDLRAGHSRYDRVVVASGNNNLLIFPVGATEPVGRSDALSGEPKNLAWLDGDNPALLVWSDDELVLLSGEDGKAKWKPVAIKGLPKIEVVAGGGANDQTVAPGNNDAEGQVIINGQQQQLILRGGVRRMPGRIIVQPGMVQQIPAAPAPAVPAGPEAIAHVKPIDDKIIVATTAGQLFAVRVSDGSIVWHTRLASAAPISRLAATDDFTVAKVDDATSTQLVVIDTLTGQLVRRMTFANEGGNVPVNFALAPDGTLVWIQPDRLCGKDLFEPGKEPNYDIPASAPTDVNQNFNRNLQPDQQALIYAGATNPDQLLISEGRILVVGYGGRYVCLHSLETGKLLDYAQDGKRAEARLTTAQGDAASTPVDWGVSLNVVGSKLYVSTHRNGPVCYDLDHPGALWVGGIVKTTEPNVQIEETAIGQDHLVLIDRPNVKPGPVANPATTQVRLQCYSREIERESGRESGMLHHASDVKDEVGISAIQGVEGGFYYLSGDKKLHFLKGVKP